MENILKGIRVLDFTRVLSGPYATRILADFGAEVIKVQSGKTAGPLPNSGGYFNAWNRNKRSITLDMSRAGGRELAMQLVGICDVVVENFSPRVMCNWNMGYEALSRRHPGIIMLRMSGMGQTGPWKHHVAYGPTVQALGGLTHLSSFGKAAPVGPGYALADHVSGLYGALTLLAALEHRDLTGNGRCIDLSQYEVVAAMIGPALLQARSHGPDPLPAGNRPDYEAAAPHGCYPCRGEDQWCVIAVYDDRQWQALVRVMGTPGWALEPGVSTLEARTAGHGSLDQRIAEWTCRQDARNLVQQLQEAGVCAGVVQDAHQLAQDPHLLDQGFLNRARHPEYGEILQDRSPIRLNADPVTALGRPDRDVTQAPALGEANAYVFMDLLGLGEAAYAAHVRNGIIA